MDNRLCIILFCFLAFFEVLGCDQERYVAKFDGHNLTIEQYLEEKDNLPEHVRASIRTLDDRKKFVRKLIIEELLFQEALKIGLQYNDTLQYRINKFERSVLITEFLRREFEGKTIVTEEEVKGFYNENLAMFTTESLEASHIVVHTLEDARLILEKLEKGGDFSELAREYSIGPSAIYGGYLGEILRGQMVPEFEDALFSLETPGDLSPITETSYGYHIIRLEKPTKTHIKPYEEVNNSIREMLIEEKEKDFLENFVNELEKKIKIEINEDVLKELG